MAAPAVPTPSHALFPELLTRPIASVAVPGRASAHASGGLSPYELERLENIRSNESQLAALGLLATRDEVRMAGRSQSVVGASRKRRAAPEPPTRASGRLKGDDPQYSGLDEVEPADGVRSELAAGEVVPPGRVLATEAMGGAVDPRLPTIFRRLASKALTVISPKGESTAAAAAAVEDDEDIPLRERVSVAARAAAAALPQPDERDLQLLRLLGGDLQPAEAAGSDVSAQEKGVAAMLSGCVLHKAMAVKVLEKAVVHLQFHVSTRARVWSPVMAADDSSFSLSCSLVPCLEARCPIDDHCLPRPAVCAHDDHDCFVGQPPPQWPAATERPLARGGWRHRWPCELLERQSRREQAERRGASSSTGVYGSCWLATLS